MFPCSLLILIKHGPPTLRDVMDFWEVECVDMIIVFELPLKLERYENKPASLV